MTSRPSSAIRPSHRTGCTMRSQPDRGAHHAGADVRPRDLAKSLTAGRANGLSARHRVLARWAVPVLRLHRRPEQDERAPDDQHPDHRNHFGNPGRGLTDAPELGSFWAANRRQRMRTSLSRRVGPSARRALVVAGSQAHRVRADKRALCSPRSLLSAQPQARSTANPPQPCQAIRSRP